MIRNFFFYLILAFAICTQAFGSVPVSVEDDFYTPPDITVLKGTTVVWTWNSNQSQSVTSGTPSAPTTMFNSGVMSSGNFQFTFNQLGTFPYFCTVDGAIHVGSVTVICSNPAQLLKNPGFEGGGASWVQSTTGIINKNLTFPPNSGIRKAQLNGKGVTNTESLSQTVTIPSDACSAMLSFYLRVSSTETGTVAHDKLQVQILDSNGAVVKTLKIYSNLNKSASYVKHSFNILGFAGKTIKIRFLGTENSSLKTTFLIDDTAVDVTEATAE